MHEVLRDNDMTHSWSQFSRAAYEARELPNDVWLARGMLFEGEIRALFMAAADYFQGVGKIVDAGAFAGLSAHCFAAGVSENEFDFDRSQVITSYDKFLATEEYTRKYIQSNFYTSRDQNGKN